jgi:hypothetical protein
MGKLGQAGRAIAQHAAAQQERHAAAQQERQRQRQAPSTGGREEELRPVAPSLSGQERAQAGGQ